MPTQKKTHYQFWFLIFCFFGAIASTFLFDHFFPNASQTPRIHDGVLSLTEPTEDDIYLDGDWEFYWNELILTKPQEDTLPVLSHLPSRLPGLGKDYHADGICSYHLTIQSSHTREDMVLYIPNIGTAYTIYVDDQIVCQSGVVSADYEKRFADNPPVVTPFTLAGTQDIVIEAAFRKTGGIYMTPVLQSLATYESNQSARTVLGYLTLGMVVSFIALFTMLHFFANREQYSLWLPVLILLILMRKLTLDETMGIFSALFVHMGYDDLNLLGIIATILSKSALLVFVVQMLDINLSRRGILYITLYYIGLFFSYVILPPDLVVGRMMNFYVYGFYFPDIYVVYKMYQANERQAPFSLILTFAFLLYIFGVMIDCFYITGVFRWNLSWILNIAILIVVLLMAFIYCKKMSEITEKARMVAKLENEVTQSNVSLLLTQIQPHFINNALTSIRYLCKTDPKKAEQSIMDFASYLRYNMASLSNRWVIPFHEEMMHVESYLAIEKIRFEEKLQVHLDIQVEDFEVPALCVEPLVENAIKHGVRGRIAGGSVSIRTYQADGYNWIIVEDDGVGFDPKNISEKSIGIPNITKRLQMMEGVIFRIESQIGKGTRATIQIPIQTKETQEVPHENIDR